MKTVNDSLRAVGYLLLNSPSVSPTYLLAPMVLSLSCLQVAESVISSTVADILAMFRDQMKLQALRPEARVLDPSKMHWHYL